MDIAFDNVVEFISFYALPEGDAWTSLPDGPEENVNIPSIFGVLEDFGVNISSESESAIYSQFGWIGTLVGTGVERDHGYVVVLDDLLGSEELEVYGSIEPDLVYNLHEGNNLISYHCSFDSDVLNI